MFQDVISSVPSNGGRFLKHDGNEIHLANEKDVLTSVQQMFIQPVYRSRSKESTVETMVTITCGERPVRGNGKAYAIIPEMIYAKISSKSAIAQGQKSTGKK